MTGVKAYRAANLLPGEMVYKTADIDAARPTTHDTPELRGLVNAYRDACAGVQGHAIPQWRALIAHLDGDPVRPTLSVEQVRDQLRGYIKHCHGSQAEAARVWEVTPQFVQYVLKGERPPNATMLADLELERVVVYRRKETPP